MEDWCFIPLVEFQRPVESMPRSFEAVLAANGGPVPLSRLYVGSFNLSFGGGFQKFDVETWE